MASDPGLLGVFLVLLCSCTCFRGTATRSQPLITSSLQIRASLGQSVRVSCLGSSAFPSGIVYWLANGSFVEDLYPDEAVSEEDAREQSGGPDGRHLLCRDLVFHAFSKRDLRTTFRCVILDPAGAAQKTLTWLPPEEEEEGARSRGSGSGMLEGP
ncbi:interleukin-18-binding protein [Paroedura picta]|uniref:interleukin-18-binding protein n=1 Tax=Paroedura picta TaxID=143630 RepID=UPI004056D05C